MVFRVTHGILEVPINDIRTVDHHNYRDKDNEDDGIVQVRGDEDSFESTDSGIGNNPQETRKGASFLFILVNTPQWQLFQEEVWKSQ